MNTRWKLTTRWRNSSWCAASFWSWWSSRPRWRCRSGGSPGRRSGRLYCPAGPGRTTTLATATIITIIMRKFSMLMDFEEIRISGILKTILRSKSIYFDMGLVGISPKKCIAMSKILSSKFFKFKLFEKKSCWMLEFTSSWVFEFLSCLNLTFNFSFLVFELPIFEFSSFWVS